MVSFEVLEVLATGISASPPPASAGPRDGLDMFSLEVPEVLATGGAMAPLARLRRLPPPAASAGPSPSSEGGPAFFTGRSRSRAGPDFVLLVATGEAGGVCSELPPSLPPFSPPEALGGGLRSSEGATGGPAALSSPGSLRRDPDREHGFRRGGLVCCVLPSDAPCVGDSLHVSDLLEFPEGPRLGWRGEGGVEAPDAVSIRPRLGRGWMPGISYSSASAGVLPRSTSPPLSANNALNVCSFRFLRYRNAMTNSTKQHNTAPKYASTPQKRPEEESSSSPPVGWREGVGGTALSWL